MIRLYKTCLVVVIAGALVTSPDALSEHHEKDADDAARVSETSAGVSGDRSSTLGPGIQRLVDLAVTDLATNLGVEEDAIEVVEAQYVTWRDSSTGCPKSGMQYLQVLTNGARIVLRKDETNYHYHSGGSRAPFHCADPSPTEPLPYRHGET
jgi:hypothetical protein